MKNVIRILLGAFCAIILAGTCLCFSSNFEKIENVEIEITTEAEEIVTKNPLEKNSPNCREVIETAITSTAKVTTTTTITTTTTTTAEHLVFNKDSKRVHRSNCKYADDSMEKIVGNVVEIGRKCEVCNPDVFFDEEYTEPTEEKKQIIEDNIEAEVENNQSSSMSCSGTFQATYYCGNAGVTYGAAGRTLQSGYSCASNLFPMGTILYIESDSFPSGYYRVDDRGGMANNVLDMYYGYGSVPSAFAWAGRVNVTVYVVD